MNTQEIQNAYEAQQEMFRRAFIYDQDAKTTTINIRYPYVIELNRIKGPTALLEWTYHLGKKGWMTARLLGEFVRVVAEIKGRDIQASV